MPAPRGSTAKHERNLERNLDIGASAEAPERRFGQPGDGRSGTVGGVAAKLARDAARREAVRRAADRRSGGDFAS